MRSPDFWRLLLKCFPQPNSTLWLPICSLCASQPRREQLWCMMRSERVGASAFVFKEARWELFPKKYIGFRIWTSRDGLEGPLAILGRESKGLHAGRRQKGNAVCLGGAEYMPEGRENELQNGRSWPRLWNSLNVILGRARLYIRGNEETIRFWARDPNQMRVVLYDVSIQLEFTLNLLHARHSIRFWGCSNERSHSFIQNKQSHCSMTPLPPGPCYTQAAAERNPQGWDAVESTFILCGWECIIGIALESFLIFHHLIANWLSNWKCFVFSLCLWYCVLGNELNIGLVLVSNLWM